MDRARGLLAVLLALGVSIGCGRRPAPAGPGTPSSPPASTPGATLVTGPESAATPAPASPPGPAAAPDPPGATRTASPSAPTGTAPSAAAAATPGTAPSAAATPAAIEPAAPPPPPVEVTESLALIVGATEPIRPGLLVTIDPGATFRVVLKGRFPEARLSLLDQGDAMVAGSGGREAATTTTVTFQPAAPLRPGSLYRLRLDGAATRELRSADGRVWSPVQFDLLAAGEPPEPKPRPRKTKRRP
jgi:hypothetical protein